MKTKIRSAVRPDGRCLVRCEGSWTATAAAEAAAVAEELHRPVVAHVDGDALEEQAALVRAGFVVSRRDERVVVHVEAALAALGSVPPPSGIEVRSAVDVDEDALRALDDELRDEVAGTSGWESSPAEFRAHTYDDPAFDPRTYLVALDESSGELLGLVRVWMNPHGARLGMLGVRRGRRRRGIASALLARASAALLEAGRSEVTTEFDSANDASRALAERLGASPVGTTIELVHAPGMPSDRRAEVPRVG